jgi:hypothetical protein
MSTNTTRQHWLRNTLFTLAGSLLLIGTAQAGPGGMIARAAFETLPGRILLVGLIILFAPLIIYNYILEKRAVKRALQDLTYMARLSPAFDWLRIRERATDCFQRVHSAWSEEDVSSVAGWMEDWYWQNQQLVHLNKWRNNGLVNVCNLKNIKSIRPLLFLHRNEQTEHGNSTLVLSITAHMQDYLRERNSDRIVEGSKTWKDVDTVWTLRLRDGVWRVANIEEGTTFLSYVKLVKGVPRIEETVVVSR